MYKPYLTRRPSLNFIKCVRVHLAVLFFVSLGGMTSHTPFSQLCQRERMSDGRCWWRVRALTDVCDRQMVLVVVSLITAARLGMKAELCLVMETQTGDKFILHCFTHSSVLCLLPFLFFFFFFFSRQVRRAEEINYHYRVLLIVFWENKKNEDRVKCFKIHKKYEI